MKSTRPYSMTLRGARSASTRARILEVARELLDDPSTAVTLERVAERADVSVQTILRHFNSKRELMIEVIGSLRSGERGVASPSPSVAASVRVLFDDYELIGDRVIRMLAEEHRMSELEAGAREGRRSHRQWVLASFDDYLSPLSPQQRTGVVTQLLVVTDVYAWKLLRRDFALAREEAEETMVGLIEGVLHRD